MVSRCKDVNSQEPIPSSQSKVGLGLSTGCWTPERQALKDWLAKEAPSLAELYEGASILLELRLPGYRRLVAHAVREIGNGLPFILFGMRFGERLDYTPYVAEISKQWKRVGFAADGTLVGIDPVQSSDGRRPTEFKFPVMLARSVSELVAYHGGPRETHFDRAKKLFTRNQPENEKFVEAIAPAVERWRDITEWFVRMTHDKRRKEAAIEDDAELQRNFHLFETALGAMARPFFATTDKLDEILDQANPEQVDRAVLLLTHGEQVRHFFDRLENPEWLIPLKNKGYFKSPPAPVPDDSGCYANLPVWPESRYLARMAKLVPEIVAQTIATIPETENIRVHDDFVEAALAMPAKLAAEFVPDAIKWTQGRFEMLVPEKFGALVSHLAAGGEVVPSLQLAKAILKLHADPRKNEKSTEENRFIRPEPQPLFHSWHYEKILEKDIPKLVQVAPADTLTLLCDLLDEAVRLSERDDQEGRPFDGSYIWRPAIDQPRHIVENARGMLVSAVCSAAQQAAQQDPARVPEIIDQLEKRNWGVFHRIALHILRLFPDAAPDLVSARVAEPERFDTADYSREYGLLAKGSFARLKTEDQNKVLDWIQKGANIELYKAAWEKFGGGPPTEAVLIAHSKIWQRDRLAPLSAHLPEDWKQRYAQLVAEFGPVEEAQTSTEPAWGWSSPKTKDELGALPIDQLIAYLKSWAPSGTGSPLEDSMEGLGRAFEALVVSEPERFSGEAEQFKGLDPTYVRALLQAFWESARQKRALRWDKVLALCAWVVEQPRTIPGRQGRITHLDPDWVWTRKAMASLLLHGFDSDAIPSGSRAQAWHIVEVLSDDPDPTPEDESRHKADWDPAGYSINTTRGEAMHAVVAYALWVYRYLERDSGEKDRVARSFDLMLEVRAVLDKHLDPEVDPSAAIRSVYGQWFPSLVLLDPDWARANAPRIFPSDEAARALRDAAWKTYVAYCSPYNEAFEILQEQYRQAIDRIEIPTEHKAGRNAPDSRLAQHLMTQYWLGNLDGGDPDGLLACFYAKADPKLCYWALDFVGRSLHNTHGPVPPEPLQRLQKLWAARLRVARAAGPPSPQKEEITAFGWWFASRKFPDSWSLDQVLEVLKLAGSIEPDHLVVERLAELAASEPAKAVECLALIIEGDKNGWGVRAWMDHARNILAQAIHSISQTARTRAIELVHHLGERGYSQFRDLRA